VHLKFADVLPGTMSRACQNSHPVQPETPLLIFNSNPLSAPQQRHTSTMSDIEVKIQGIEHMLDKLVIMVDKRISHGSPPSAKSRKQSQSPWKKIRSMIDVLVENIQHVKEMIEVSHINTGHNRNAGADDRGATPGGPLRISDPLHEKQHFPDATGGSQNGGTTSRHHSTETNRPAIPAPLLSVSEMDENHARSTTIPNEFRTAPTTPPNPVTTTVESSEVGQNSTMVATMLQRPCLPLTSTTSQSAASTHSVSTIPRNPNVTIPHREEDGVIVLLPSNMDQCRNTPLLLSLAESLGARETGIFKYVLSDDFQFTTQAVSRVTTQVSKFTSSLGPDNILRISRTENLEALDFVETSFIPTETNEIVDILSVVLPTQKPLARCDTVLISRPILPKIDDG
jgi:hypothetical protein